MHHTPRSFFRVTLLKYSHSAVFRLLKSIVWNTISMHISVVGLGLCAVQQSCRPMFITQSQREGKAKAMFHICRLPSGKFRLLSPAQPCIHLRNWANTYPHIGTRGRALIVLRLMWRGKCVRNCRSSWWCAKGKSAQWLWLRIINEPFRCEPATVIYFFGSVPVRVQRGQKMALRVRVQFREKYRFCSGFRFGSGPVRQLALNISQ